MEVKEKRGDFLLPAFKGASQGSQRNDAHIVKNATALK